MPNNEAKAKCVCFCPCGGCKAVRQSWSKCDCATCQLQMSSQRVPEQEEHQCPTMCTCQSCKAIKALAKKCDCLACLLLSNNGN